MDMAISDSLEGMEALLIKRNRELSNLPSNSDDSLKILIASSPNLKTCSVAARNNIIQGHIADLRDEIQTSSRMLTRLEARRKQMEIAISDLRTLCNKLLSNIEQLEGQTVEIQRDYYWGIPRSALYDMEKDPCKNGGPLPVRQLTKHWTELQPILKGDKHAHPLALVWFSALLRAIGDQYAEEG